MKQGDVFIQVKKSDGTSVRMTLDEFHAYRNNTTNREPVNEPPKKRKLEVRDLREEMKNSRLPVAQTPHSLAVNTSTKEIVLKEKKKIDLSSSLMEKNVIQWTKDDATSPLDASLHDDLFPASHRAVTQSADEQTREIVRHLPFFVSKGLESRLVSLIQSRVKDIRTDNQVRECALRGNTEGGLGLTEKEADAVLATLKKFVPKRGTVRSKGVESPSRRIPSTSSYRQQESSLPSHVKEYTQKVTYGAKQKMHDVTSGVIPLSPVKTSVGPVEEMAAMSLIDFRRLGTTLEQRKGRLIEKFDTLKKESYLMYLDALGAWRKSPLSQTYLTVLARALRDRVSVETSLRGDMTKEEFQSMIAVSKYIHE